MLPSLSLTLFLLYQNGNHVLFIQFLTMLVVIMIYLGMPNDWPVALIRIGNTLLGGGMGILAGYLFWPQWERERIPEQLGRTIAANRAYIASVLAAYITRGEKQGERDVETATRSAKPTFVDSTLKESLHDVLISLQQLTVTPPEATEE